MSHMSIIKITDDGKDGRNPDIWGHRGKFLGDVDSDHLFWNRQGDVAVPDGQDGEPDDDDPLAEEVEWGFNARTLPGTCRNRGHEGFDQRIHTWLAQAVRET